MSFVSLHFMALVIVLLALYYLIPYKFQPYLLLLGSLYFYYRSSSSLIIVLLVTTTITYIGGLVLQKISHILIKKVLLGSLISCILIPLIVFKYSTFLLELINKHSSYYLILPMGISFYTLQLIGYLVDVYRNEIKPEQNFFYFLLFASFFPQILQGPIPRYANLSNTLYEKHNYDSLNIWLGLQKILWGLFFKLMIASKAAVFADDIFNSTENIAGSLYLVAGILYSFQLYTDFISCVLIAQGVSLLFGIKLSENFAQPYFATSVKDFWHRWHISLSTWLRDYIYIPLGGNRKGELRTNINLLITFFISGIWHGAGYKYIFWGSMHGIYQLIGKYTLNLRCRFYSKYKYIQSFRPHLQRLTTFILVMNAWIIFRSRSLKAGLHALYSIVVNFKFSELLNGNIFTHGLNIAEFVLLILLIIFLLIWDYQLEIGCNIMYRFLYIGSFKKMMYSFILLLIILIFGTYGYGYDASSFIYGGF